MKENSINAEIGTETNTESVNTEKTSTDEVLFTSKWNEVRVKDGWYEYVHMPWGNGIGVAVLGYRCDEQGEIEYLGRYELTPCHTDEIKLCALTGGYDNKDEYTILGCALNELREEGGFKAPPGAVIPLGEVYPSKGSDTVQHLFAVDLDHEGVETCEPVGDGTRGEVGSYVKWISEMDLVSCNDPLNHAMFARLQAIFKIKELQEKAIEHRYKLAGDRYKQARDEARQRSTGDNL